MNRLQKKCVIATASFHLLLLVILFVGPAFFLAREKPDTSPVLDMIPANLVDAASTGVKSAPPPAPTPIVTPPQPPTPPAPQPIVQPAPAPVPTLAERVEKLFKSEPAKPTPTPIENQSHTPKVNLTPVTRAVPKNTSTPNNTKSINSALTALRNQLSHATEIAPVGNSSAAAANYAQVVKSVYEQAWVLPDDMASDAANTKVRVTISSDGTVVSAKIITPSGEAKLDASVQRTLERVQVIEPFPPGSTDTERTYIINFNPQIKRMLG
jgi:TonB family protein